MSWVGPNSACPSFLDADGLVYDHGSLPLALLAMRSPGGVSFNKEEQK